MCCGSSSGSFQALSRLTNTPAWKFFLSNPIGRSLCKAASADGPAGGDSRRDQDECTNGLHGFTRPDMYTEALRGTVLPYHQHVFLCFGDPSVWPPIIETSPSPAFELPRLLASALRAHKGYLPKKTLFTVCQGSADDSESVKGDVLIFPRMAKLKDFGCNDIQRFLGHLLQQGDEWEPERTEKLDGHHIFVCAHGNRDMRCGVCGPSLIQRFQEEIAYQGLGRLVHVRACSHVGGHKFAGNVLVYGRDSMGKVTSHWYGYVTPRDVVVLLDEHIKKGQVIERLWRGEMN